MNDRHWRSRLGLSDLTVAQRRVIRVTAYITTCGMAAMLCTKMLTGTIGTEVTVSGKTGSVILAFLLITYTIGSFRTWGRSHSRTTRQKYPAGSGR